MKEIIMTKEQIQEHKEVILWFINNPDKGVWHKGIASNRWHLYYNPSFYKDFIYIQNDEYAESRKAIIDNETVQHNLHSDCVTRPARDEYVSVSKINTQIPVSYYRIKPKEPEFNIGDWVTVGDSNPCQFKRFTGDLPEWNKDLDYEVIEFTDTLMRYQIPNFDRSIVKLWKPKQGKLCVFWDNNNDWYVISKFIDFSNGLYIDHMSKGWDNIAPLEFIDTLRGIE